MKKIFFSILSFLAFGLMAQAQVTFSPGTFTAEDQVTLTVDVTGSRGGAMENQPEAYIWIFANVSGRGNPKDGSVNTAWGNSPVEAKMTKLGPNRYSYTFTPTTMFGLAPGELFDFGFLVKAKDGSRQTDDFKPFAFDPLIFTPNKLRIFPSKVGKEDVVTMNFETTLGTTVDEQRMTPVSATVTMYDDAGNQVGSPLTIPARKTADKIWSATFIPDNSFTPAAGRTLKRFTYKFNGTVFGPTGAPQTVSSSEATVEFFEMK
jgi:hypothetical protein